VDCVLATETHVYTYTVVNGEASVRGEGDLHDPHYTHYRKTTSLTTTAGLALFTNSSATYTLTLYPNEEHFQVYSTNNPFVATVGAVCIIVFTSLLFFLYDFFVRQEFNEKRSVLEAKRQFVRYVSHEVRTPLNCVCMGLRLMQEEIGAAFLPNNITPDRNGSERTTATSRDSVAVEICNSVLGLSQEILSNAESAVDILDDLLNYDKIEIGKLSLELSIVPIWDLIERTANEFMVPAKAKKINFVINFSPLVEDESDLEKSTSLHAMQLPRNVRERRVIGDTVRITQALRNLLSNGLKFTPEGGKKRAV
jgi:signal transduction histidine kinase